MQQSKLFEGDRSLKGLWDDIKSQQRNNIQTLHELCMLNSGTTNLLGIAQIMGDLKHLFRPFSDSIEEHAFSPITQVDLQGQLTQQTVGNALIIRKRPQLSRRILLVGHMDTVYGIHHPFQNLTQLDDNTLQGPGVTDMKGGLVVMVQALKKFEQMPIAPTLGWDVIINSDEEIGSPASSALWADIAHRYQAALIYEPALDAQGTFVRNRSGSGKFTIVATGKAAHVGRAFPAGRNAICYLVEILLAFHALNGQRPGVIINIGQIAGGDAVNMVPERAAAKLDIRIQQPDDEVWFKQQQAMILARSQRTDYTINIHGGFGRPVKRVCKKTERLYQRIQNIGINLGLSIQWQDSGGCSDGNNLAAHGLPVIDTLGVRGGHIHSSQEFILLDSLAERTLLSTLILQDLAQGGLEELKNDAVSPGRGS